MNADIGQPPPESDTYYELLTQYDGWKNPLNPDLLVHINVYDIRLNVFKTWPSIRTIEPRFNSWRLLQELLRYYSSVWQVRLLTKDGNWWWQIDFMSLEKTEIVLIKSPINWRSRFLDWENQLISKSKLNFQVILKSRKSIRFSLFDFPKALAIPSWLLSKVTFSKIFLSLAHCPLKGMPHFLTFLHRYIVAKSEAVFSLPILELNFNCAPCLRP